MNDMVRVGRVAAEGFDYQTEADKTCSPHWNPHYVDYDALRRSLQQFVDLCGVLNVHYKLLLRGKTPDHFNLPMPPEHKSLAAHGGAIPPGEIDLIHGILGSASEVGELAEIALDLLEGKPADRVNAIEETGDMRWFLNRILRWADCSDLECEMTNIDKLHGRHGSSFDIFRDANRDLARERVLLEHSATVRVGVVEQTTIDRIYEEAPTLPLGPHGDETVQRRPIADVPGMDC